MARAAVTFAASLQAFVDRHYRLLAAAILVLACFNLTFRISQEFVSEWDESLYAINAWEAVTRGSWIATTFLGEVDYYNTKPPLLVWMIAAAFKAIGPGLLALRLPSIVCAWVTVLVVQLWARRAYGFTVALLSSLVLSTTFGFLYVHSGRSASTDAPFTLVVTLTAVIAWLELRKPSARVWLGPVLAAGFMLRGMAVLMPLGLFLVLRVLNRRSAARPRAAFTAAAIALFAAPIAAWIYARWRIDGWTFFDHLFMYDFVARTTTAIEEHPGGPFFYLDELQKNQFDWLLAAVVALLLAFTSSRDLRAGARRLFAESDTARSVAAWAAVTLIVPSLMATKVPWYLNTFFPVFAVLVALAISRVFETARASRARWRVVTMAAVLGTVVVAAEARLLWYSWHFRDLSLSEQSLVLERRAALAGRRVFLIPHSNATRFVATAVAGAEVATAPDTEAFARESQPGDYLLTNRPCDLALTVSVATSARHHLCARR